MIKLYFLFWICSLPNIFGINSFPTVAEIYSVGSQPEEKSLLEVLKLRPYPVEHSSLTLSEGIKLETALSQDQYFPNKDAESENSFIVKRDAHDFQNDAPENEDYDMELAEVNVFRPVFQYRLAYAKQIRNSRRQRFR